jgi:hypothetical protein
MTIKKEDILKKIIESNSTSDASLIVESKIYALESEGSDDLYKNAGDNLNQSRAKLMTEQALQRPEFLNTQRDFIKSVNEAASNTSVEYITSFRKLLPEIMARSVNMSLAIENVAHVVPMTSNSMLLPLHRRILGANSGTTEALYAAIDSAFGGTGTHANTFDPYVDSGDTDTTPADGVTDNFSYGTGRTRIASEDLTFSGMSKVSNRIDQVQLTATSRNVAMSVSTEALQDAQNEYGVNLIREGLITMQAEMYRSISAELYAKLALIAKKEATEFDFASVGTANADNFYLKNAYLLQFIETMRATIQSETREPGLKFRIIATPRVISRLKMVDRLHAPVNPQDIKRDYDNISFYRGIIGEYELYEAVDYANNRDFVMVVGKGNNASTSPIIYGNYVPFFLQNIKSPDTTHDLYFGKVRSGMVANPFGNAGFSETFALANNGTCRYARFLRVKGLV